jgi:hypothetical protein
VTQQHQAAGTPLSRPINKQQQEQQRQQPTDVVELLSSDDEGSDPPAAAAAAAKQHGSSLARPPASQVAGVGGGGEGASGLERDPLGCDTFMCPVCCLEFSQLAALNAHLDACLL